MSSHGNRQPQRPPITLAQINEMLNAVGFPIINPEKIESLLKIAPRERIIRAIRLAKTDNGARAFLTDLFNQAGIALQQPAHAQGSAPAQQTSAEQARSNPANDYRNSRAPAAPRQEYREESPRARTSQRSDDDDGSSRMSPEDRMSVHVYGGKAALCFEADMTKGKVPTIALDAAMSTGPRQYDWGNKIRLQMTRAELPVVTAVLIGALPACEFKNHGHDNSKGFSMERQNGGKVFIKVFAKDQGVRAIPVMPADVFYVASLFIRQMRKANPWLDATSLMSMIRATQSQG